MIKNYQFIKKDTGKNLKKKKINKNIDEPCKKIIIRYLHKN